jgi:hypothetical protein
VIKYVFLLEIVGRRAWMELRRKLIEYCHVIPNVSALSGNAVPENETNIIEFLCRV